MKLYTLVLFFVCSTRADNSIGSSNFNCYDLKTQESIDSKEIMGKWYVVEILEHKIEPTKPMNGARVVIDTCPILKLRITDSLLRLLWSEEAGDVEYTFRVPDHHGSPGYWLTTTLQNGTLLEKQYNQFTGSVHVMKAVASHMVLTFCSRNPNNQELYSVLLSREHILQKGNIRGVHNLLLRRRLSIVSIRETCANVGTVKRCSYVVVLTMFLGPLTTYFLSKLSQ